MLSPLTSHLSHLSSRPSIHLLVVSGTSTARFSRPGPTRHAGHKTSVSRCFLGVAWCNRLSGITIGDVISKLPSKAQLRIFHSWYVCEVLAVLTKGVWLVCEELSSLTRCGWYVWYCPHRWGVVGTCGTVLTDGVWLVCEVLSSLMGCGWYVWYCPH